MVEGELRIARGGGGGSEIHVLEEGHLLVPAHFLEINPDGNLSDSSNRLEPLIPEKLAPCKTNEADQSAAD